MQKIRTVDIDRLYRKVQETKEGEKPLSAATVRVVGAIASSCFKHALRKKEIRRNPCAMADVPEMVRRTSAILDRDGDTAIPRVC